MEMTLDQERTERDGCSDYTLMHSNSDDALPQIMLSSCKSLQSVHTMESIYKAMTGHAAATVSSISTKTKRAWQARYLRCHALSSCIRPISVLLFGALQCHSCMI